MRWSETDSVLNMSGDAVWRLKHHKCAPEPYGLAVAGDANGGGDGLHPGELCGAPWWRTTSRRAQRLSSRTSARASRLCATAALATPLSARGPFWRSPAATRPSSLTRHALHPRAVPAMAVQRAHMLMRQQRMSPQPFSYCGADKELNIRGAAAARKAGDSRAPCRSMPSSTVAPQLPCCALLADSSLPGVTVSCTNF